MIAYEEGGRMSVQRIQQAIRYIEEHLCEDIHYAQVAGSIRMSP